MATGTVDRGPRPRPSVKSKGQWIEYDEFIDAQIRKARSQLKGVELAWALVTYVAVTLTYFLGVALVDHWLLKGGLGPSGRLIFCVVFVAGSVWFAVRLLAPLLLFRINPVYAAESIERGKPTLKNALINFLMLRQDHTGVNERVYEAVEQQAASSLSKTQIEATVDRTQLVRMGYFLVVALLLFIGYSLFSPKSPLETVGRVIMPWADLKPPTRVNIGDVLPGDHVEYIGQPVEISAEIRGIGDSEAVRVIYSTADGQAVDQAVQMFLPSGSIRHAAKIPAGDGGLQQDIQYRIEAGDATSKTYHLQAATAPIINVDMIDLQFPAYTEKAKLQQKVGDIDAVEGTKVTIHGRANRPITRADLVLRGAENPVQLPMTVDTDRLHTTVSFTLSLDDKGRPKFSRYMLQPDGRDKPSPVEYRLNVTPDLPPEVKILEPTKEEIELPANGRLGVEVRAMDPDFALSSVALTGKKPGAKDLKPLFAETLLKEIKHGPFNGKFVVDAAKLGLKEGDVVDYWATARDNRQPKANETETAHYRIRVIAASRRQQGVDNKPNDQQDQPGDATQPNNPQQNPGDPNKDPTQQNKNNADPQHQPNNRPEQNGNDNKNPQEGNAKNNDQDRPGAEGSAKQPQQSPDKSSGQKPNDKQQPGSAQQQPENNPSGKSDAQKQPNSGNPSGQQQSQPSGDNGAGQQQNPATNKQQPNSGDRPQDSQSSSGNQPQKGSQPKNADQPSGQNQPHSGDQHGGDQPQSSQQQRSGEKNGQSGDKPNSQDHKSPDSHSGQDNDSHQGQPPAQDDKHDTDAVHRLLDKIQPHTEGDSNTKKRDDAANQTGNPEGDDTSGHQNPGSTGQNKPNSPQNSGDDRGQSSGQKQNQPGNKQQPSGNNNSADNQPGGKQRDKQSSDKQSGDKQSGQKQPGDQKSGDKQPGAQQQSGNKQQQPGDKQQPGAQQQPGNQPQTDKPNDQQQSGDKKPGDKSADKNQGQPKNGQQPNSDKQQSGDKQQPGDKTQNQPGDKSSQKPTDKQGSRQTDQQDHNPPKAGDGQPRPGQHNQQAKPDDKSKSDAERNDPNPSANKSGEKRPSDDPTGADNKPGSENGNGQSPDSQRGQGTTDQHGTQPGGDRPPTGQQGSPSGQKNPTGGQHSDQPPTGQNSSGTKPNNGNGANSKSGSNPSDKKPNQDHQSNQPKPNDGSGDTERQKGAPGAGQESNKQDHGSPNPQEGNQPNQHKDQDAGGKPDSNDQDSPKSPSNSPKESNSQGGSDGDKAGGGKSGGGQQASKPGSGGAGSHTASDSGSGEAQGKGSGNTSNQAGGDQKSSGSTGNHGSEPGAGDNGQPGQQGNAQGGSPSNSNSGGQGKQNSETGQGDSQTVPNGGAGGVSPASGSEGGAAGATGDAANDAFAKKQFDLALDGLKHPDPKTLKELNWTADDAAALARRLEQMRANQSAAGQAGDKARKEMSDLLRSLGARDSQVARRGGVSIDSQHGLQESSDNGPPPEYMEQFNAFQQGALGER